MAQFRFRKILNFTLKILAFISIVAVITFFVWQMNKTVIHKIDKIVVDTYVSGYHNKYNKAKELTKTDINRSNYALEKLLSEMEPIKNLDRVAPLKRKVLALLTERYTESAKFDKALIVSGKWIDFDDQDLNALAKHGLILSSIPEKEEEGLQRLSDLFVKVPEASVVAETYAKLLLNNGKTVDAFRALSQSLIVPGNKPEGPWRVYWHSGEGFNKNDFLGFRVKADNNNIVKINFELSSGTKHLRLDPPPFSRLTMYNPVLTVDIDDTQKTTPLLDLPKRFHQVTQIGSKLKTSGGNDPYFIWEMEDIPAGDKMSVSIEFKLGVLFPEAMLDIALSEKGDILENELSSINDKNVLKHLLEIQENSKQEALLPIEELFEPVLKSLKGTTIELYWRVENKGFSEERKSTTTFDFSLNARRVNFDLSLNYNGRTDELRLDLPSVKGRSFTLTKVELVEGEKITTIDIENTNFILQNNITKKDNKIVVLGEDPHFSFKIKSVASPGMLRIVGFVR